MSIAKITKDILGEKEEKKKININGGNIVEGILIVLIIISSFNLLYWTVPIFLSVSFLLLQLRKFINNMKKK